MTTHITEVKYTGWVDPNCAPPAGRTMKMEHIQKVKEFADAQSKLFKYEERRETLIKKLKESNWALVTTSPSQIWTNGKINGGDTISIPPKITKAGMDAILKTIEEKPALRSFPHPYPR